MWLSKKEYLRQDKEIKYLVATNEGQNLTFGQTISLWRTDADFRQFFLGLLANAPFTGYRWECPAVTSQTLDRAFEFVLVEDNYLARRRPNMGAFMQHFTSVPSDGVVTFTNLGGDATLIVPEPTTFEIDYGHLAAFCRLASPAQQHELWCSVGEAMEKQVSDKPVWLSTAGGGVPWLHVRLDDRPKYYRHQAYRAA